MQLEARAGTINFIISTSLRSFLVRIHIIQKSGFVPMSHSSLENVLVRSLRLNARPSVLTPERGGSHFTTKSVADVVAAAMTLRTDATETDVGQLRLQL